MISYRRYFRTQTARRTGLFTVLSLLCIPVGTAQEQGALSQRYEQELRTEQEEARHQYLQGRYEAAVAPMKAALDRSEDYRRRIKAPSKQANLVAPPINEQDSLALVAFYNSTDGDNWGNNHNWLTGAVPEWAGIGVDGTRVSAIDLTYNNLSGTLPKELGDLDKLTYLAVSGNELSGDIPTEIATLDELTTLALDRNDFSGTIPTGFGNLTKLQHLDLWQNNLTGTIPTGLGNLTQLAFMSIGTNQLTGTIPEEFGNLVNLTFLDVGPNLLEGEIPDALRNLTLLTQLEVEGNQLAGTLPSWIGDFSELSFLSMRECQFTGSIPAEFGNLTKVTSLDLRDNQLTGEIPTELGNMSSLAWIGFGGNQITGPIPTTFGNLSQLATIEFPNMALTGEIPSELGDLTNLTWLQLGNNQLTGEIPSSLGSLANVQDLLLYSNNLSGSIPSSLGNLSDLGNLNLANNQLEGSIPAELGSLGKLVSLSLNNNQLDGGVPSELGSLGNLNWLHLGSNQLTGEIPSELGNLGKVDYIDLSNNQLTGSISAELGNLGNLTNLQLHNNALSGSLPPELGNLRKIKTIHLPDNNFSGELPSDWGQMSNLEYLWLYNNDLTGALAPELGDLGRLRIIDLGGNEMTGTLPPELGNLGNLEGMYLWGGNQFSGAVPPQYTNLAKLSELGLNDNLIEDLPDMSSMSSLDNLYVRVNKLTFEDIEPNLGISNFDYCCQRTFGEEQTFSVGEGESLTLQFGVGGANNTYQWRKDGGDIADANSDTYVINPVTPDDAGTYQLVVNNTLVTDLTLLSASVTVNVQGAQPVTFQVDMSGELLNIEPGFVIGVRGGRAPLTWEDTTPLSDNDGDGIYSGSIGFAADAGTDIEYVFVYNASDNSTVVTESSNRMFTFNGSETLDVVYWNNNTPPSAVISTDVSAGIAPLTVHFDASSSSDPDGSITNYEWDFDDGGSATGATTNHTFSSSGSYEVVLTVTDNSGAKTATSETISVINYPSSVSYSINRTFSTATSASSYRLVALPGDVKVGMAATLSGSSGADNDWRAFRDTGGSGSVESYLSEYDGSDAFTFKAGRGFWLLSKQAWSHAQEVSTAPLSSDGSTSISVHDGWNIISNPFDVNVTWASVLAFNGLGNTTPLYRFNGSFSQVSTFTTAKTSGEAFYFNNATGLSTLKVPYPSTGVVQPREGELVPALEEVLTVRAQQRRSLSSGGEDTLWSVVRVGFLEGEEEVGQYNQVAPPAHFEALGLRVVEQVEREETRHWSTWVGSRGSASGTRIGMSLRVAEAGVVELEIEGLEAYVDEEVVLLDETTSRFYEVDALSNRVELEVLGAGVYGLRVLIGDAEYVSGVKEAELPEAVSLAGVYPNPFRDRVVIEYGMPEGSAEVEMEVYDVLGRRVVELLGGGSERGGGVHRVVWDGRDGGGVRVSSGLYVLRLRVGEVIQTHSLILAR